MARLLQQTIDKKKLLPQPIVAVNNAAAGGATGTRQVKDSEADGYTFGMFHMGLLTAPAMGVVDYDHSAFELIGQVGRTPVGMGTLADGRFKTIQDVLSAAKAKPDSITVAMNIGLLPHFVPLMFEQDAGIKFRYVQAGGGAVRLRSLLGRHTELSLFSGPEFLLFSRRASNRSSCSRRRARQAPDVPTAKEIGVGTVFEERVIAFAPKGRPRSASTSSRQPCARAWTIPSSPSATGVSASIACSSTAASSDGFSMVSRARSPGSAPKSAGPGPSRM